MRKHTKIYLDYFGYDQSDFICCEVCGKKAIDIHHVKPRGMGGSKERDKIENLMALCRVCHEKFGDRKQFFDFLNLIHSQKIYGG